MKIEDIAKVCHNVNKAYCDSVGDTSQVDWDQAAQWQKDSAVKGVRFTIDNPSLTPESQHQAWLDDKLAQGWKYGSKKDVEEKTHPCCVPYDKLPMEQKVKDYLFRAVVKSLLTI